MNYKVDIQGCLESGRVEKEMAAWLNGHCVTSSAEGHRFELGQCVTLRSLYFAMQLIRMQ
jgi:hypothetical protein